MSTFKSLEIIQASCNFNCLERSEDSFRPGYEPRRIWAQMVDVNEKGIVERGANQRGYDEMFCQASFSDLSDEDIFRENWMLEFSTRGGKDKVLYELDGERWKNNRISIHINPDAESLPVEEAFIELIQGAKRGGFFGR